MSAIESNRPTPSAELEAAALRPADRSTERATARRGWRPPALLQFSAALHCGAFGLTAYQPRWWPWTLAAVLADHASLVAAGLLPRSHLIGSNWTRLPAAAAAQGQIALTLDDGPNPDITPRALRILEEHGARATFFCIGEQARRYPALLRECVAAGHAIENHSDSHPFCFSVLGPRHLEREIARAQETLSTLSGQSPRFFRAPAGLRNPLLDLQLHRAGLQLASWTRRGFDTANGDPDRIFNRLTHNLEAGDILLLHDGRAAPTARGVPVSLEVLPRLLQLLRAREFRTITLREALPCPL
jgi:peptidoglycan/xylan/chitin deacetylase (PgdA/CDA1 family)